jgi:hypothetical protein
VRYAPQEFYRRQQIIGGQGGVDRLKSIAVSHRGGGGFHVGDEVGPILFTAFREVHLSLTSQVVRFS